MPERGYGCGMRNLSLVRKLVGGMPCMLLAALLIFARLVSPSMGMPVPAADPESAASAALQVICHSGSSDDASTPKGSSHQPGQEDCLFCPACHLVTQAAIPAPSDPIGGRPTLHLIARAAPVPPSTGPPTQPLRVATHPTGPPFLSV